MMNKFVRPHALKKKNRFIVALRSFIGFHRFILELREPNFIRILSITDLPTFFKSSLKTQVSKATTTLNVKQNLVFSFHFIFLYHPLYRTKEMTRGEGRDEKHLVCLIGVSSNTDKRQWRSSD